MSIISKKELLDNVKYDSNGLVPVIAQDYHSKKVRMLAYMNEEALIKTLESKRVTYFSRSRQSLWVKGETSGYFQYLKGISIDCDGDCLLIQIEQIGGISCHTGNSSCFFREISDDMEITINRENKIKDDDVLGGLLETVKDRKINPKEGSYTNYLIDKGMNKILKKIGEEASETIIAAKDALNNKDLKNDVIFEISDLMYHLTVMMEELDVSWVDVFEELKKR